MTSEKKGPSFKIEHLYPEDVKRQNLAAAARVTEEQRSEFIFNGEPLYQLGRGHSFLNGFYTSYITRSGIAAERYDSGKWDIDGDSYEFVDGAFVLIPRKEHTTPTPEQMMESWNSVPFPIVKSVADQVIGIDLMPVKPMQVVTYKDEKKDEQH